MYVWGIPFNNIIYIMWFNYYINVYVVFIEKTGTQGKKRPLESDNDDPKNSSPPRVSIINYLI